jgi:hypothetical protein
MAEKVEIEIPGIGKIQAENAATEATLNEIKKVLEETKKINEKGFKDLIKAQEGSAKAKAAGGGGGGGNAKNDKASADAAKGLSKAAAAANENAAENSKAAKAANFAGRGILGLARTGNLLVGALGSVTSSAINAANGMTNMISTMANVGNDLGNAARAFEGIPVVGGLLANTFGAVAGAAKGVVAAYQESASIGATFGGSVQEMSRAASGVGMDLKSFGALIAKNGENLMLLGGTTEEGAKRFGELGKQIQNSGVGAELQRMGYSTEQINGGMVRYIGILGKTGALQGMTTAQIAASSGSYLKELDALAKITGVSREEKQKEQEALMKDAKVRAAMAGLDADQQKQMMAYITSFPKEQQGAIADMIATGNVTTEEAIKLQSLLPGVAERTMQFGRTLQSGGKISQDSLNQAKNASILEAQESVKRNKARGLYDKEAGAQYVAMADLAAQKVNGYAQAIDEQGKSVAKKNLAEKLEKAQQDIAKVGNEFQMFLAQSGLLDTLLSAFKSLAGFVSSTVIPMFEVVGQVITDFVIPGLQMVGDFIVDYFLPAFESVADFITDNFEPIFATVAAVAMPMLIAALAAKTAAVWTSVAGYIAANAAMLPFIAAGLAAVAVFYGIKAVMSKFGLDLGMVGDALKYVGTMFKTVFLKIKEGFFFILNKIPGMRGDFDEDLKEISKEQEANAKEQGEIGDRLAAKQKSNLAETKAKEDALEQKKHDREEKRNQRKHDREMKGIGDKEDREKAAAEAAAATGEERVDMSDPVKMFQSFADKNKSSITKKKEEESKDGAKSSGKPAGPQAAPSMTGNKIEGLGKVAAQFESGGKAGTVSSGHGDFGGKSYGAFQLAGRGGAAGNEVEQFLKSSGYADKFKGMKVGSKDFDAKWKELGEDKDFAKAQQEHAKKTHYDPQMAKLQKSGIDLSGKGLGVQEAVMSTANQYGANTDTIIKALKGKDTTKMSDKDIINAIQDYKAENVKTNFKSSSEAVRAGVSKRIEQERAALLGVEGGPQAAGKPVTGATAADADKARKDAAAKDPRRTDAGEAKPEAKPVEQKVETQIPAGTALGDLVKVGIVPTTIAFQDLVKKGIMPMLSGVQVKDQGKVKPEDSLKKGEEIISSLSKNKTRGMFDSLSSDSFTAMADISKQRGKYDMAASESPKSEIIAQKEKEAQEKIALEKQQAENRAKLKQEEAMAMGPSGQNNPAEAPADLNTALAELIRLTKETNEINSRQLSVQKNLSGDLFA